MRRKIALRCNAYPNPAIHFGNWGVEKRADGEGEQKYGQREGQDGLVCNVEVDSDIGKGRRHH